MPKSMGRSMLGSSGSAGFDSVLTATLEKPRLMTLGNMHWRHSCGARKTPHCFGRAQVLKGRHKILAPAFGEVILRLVADRPSLDLGFTDMG